MLCFPLRYCTFTTVNSTATVCEDILPKFFTLLAAVEPIFLIAGIMDFNCESREKVQTAERLE